MWIKIPLILLTIGTCSSLGYKYPSFRSCCRWKPIHGPIGIPHSPQFIQDSYSSYKVSPVYGVPQQMIHKPIPVYGVPHQMQKPAPVYGVPNFDSHQSFNGGQFPVFQTNGHQNNFQSHGYSQNLVSPQNQHVFAHHKVISTQQEEAQLPAQLLNPFYKNPAIRDALAKHSWFGPGENPVGMRETDRISRQRIYEVLSHAGLIRRR